MSERIPWDDAFKQLMRETLTQLGLKVIEDPKLGKLPLRADLVIISREKVQGSWRSHPVWRHLSDQNLLEFKSISDPLHRETLRSYWPIPCCTASNTRWAMTNA